MNHSHQVIIIGAGISGLSAALHLKRQGIEDIRIIEQDSRVGGKVQTDQLNGYLLDRGFQIFLPAYEEPKVLLDYPKLQFQFFDKGALILDRGKKRHFSDPSQGIGAIARTAITGPGTLSDKLKLLAFKLALDQKDTGRIFSHNPKNALGLLESKGFSKQMITQFWKPFYQGVFLEDKLATSAAMLEFTFKMFSAQGGAVPKRGMQAIPDQMASQIGQDHFHLQESVTQVTDRTVHTDKATYHSDAVVLATDAHHQAQLLGKAQTTQYHGVTNVYYSAPILPFRCRQVIVNANAHQRINNVVFLSEISPDYAPDGQHLISVSANGQHHEQDLRKELQTLFGAQVQDWTHLKSYDIARALPDQRQVRRHYQSQVREGIYSCGDFHLYGSLDAACRSGRLVAERIRKDLKA